MMRCAAVQYAVLTGKIILLFIKKQSGDGANALKSYIHDGVISV